MKRLTDFLISLAVFTFSIQSAARATEVPELPEILEKHWLAMGGMYNWSKVESIRLNGKIERNGKWIQLCIIKKRPNQIRATVTLPAPGSDDAEFQVIRAHDGQTGWTATRLAGSHQLNKESLSPAAADALLADAGILPPLIKLWRQGATITLLEPTSIDGETAFTIEVIDGPPRPRHIFYLSSETFRLLAYESHDPEQGITKTWLSEYKETSGVFLPTRTTVESQQTGQSVITTESIEIGVGIYQDYFDR